MSTPTLSPSLTLTLTLTLTLALTLNLTLNPNPNQAVGALPPRRRAALAVRLSEKRCLEGLVHTNLTLTLAPTRTLSLALTLTVTRCAPRRSRRLAPSAAPRSGTTSCSV